jgi:hypothetical protein
LNFFGHIQYSSRKAGRKMVRKIAEEKTIPQIYNVFFLEEECAKHECCEATNAFGECLRLARKLKVETDT